jgi:acyl-CoA reductase-like NAD-dependent aldehyde dehydrogenase
MQNMRTSVSHETVKRGNKKSYVIKPIGTLAVMPWNLHLHQAIWPTIPALMAGVPGKRKHRF